MVTVPNQPKTPNRTIRIADEIYFPALAKARREGTTLSDVIRVALVAYLGDDDEWWSKTDYPWEK